jgi:hypothetical protein
VSEMERPRDCQCCGHSIRSHNDLGYCQVGPVGYGCHCEGTKVLDDLSAVNRRRQIQAEKDWAEWFAARDGKAER